ncbi:MAG: hypothetical protein FGM22_10780 [Burkholderiaceae bacterium]|nr:hypothetical protein [Burkholderiaceae bacterium]
MPSNKDFYDALTNLSLSAENVNLNVDQVETKLDTANGILTTLSADIALIKPDVDDIRVDLANGVTINQPVAVTDNGGSLTVDGTVTANVVIPSGTVTNRSSTITTGGTSQQVAASNTSRKYFLIQNISDTDMYLGVGYTPTTTTGILLSKNGSGITFESGFIPTSAINVLCATTGKAFVSLEG